MKAQICPRKQPSALFVCHSIHAEKAISLYPMRFLDGRQDLGLDKVAALDDLGASVGVNGLTVGFEELRHVELWRSDDLDLSDVDIVERVDALRDGVSTSS